MSSENLAVSRHPLEARIGYTFRNPALLELALRHASLADARVNSNERLEFLGEEASGVFLPEVPSPAGR